MNIAEWAIRKKTVTLVIVFLIIGGGIAAYENLGRLEDPEYTIKEALVITPYPGATPQEVEEEVVDELETAIQQLPQLKEVRSISKAGISIITVEIKDKYGKNDLPQVWDELRRKVNDAQSLLPPGAGPSLVQDDFGDVYGILLSIVGKGYSYRELEDYADFIRKELLLVPDVAKVEIYGIQKQQVFVELSRDKMAQLRISYRQIYTTLARQNLVSPAGQVRVGDAYIRINPTGEFTSVKEIGDLMLYGRQAGAKKIYLKDISKISRGYQTPPKNIIRFDGDNAYVIGVSIVPGGNVVNMGEGIKQKLQTLESQTPVGMNLGVINFQPDDVTKSIDNFMISLMEALAIVIVVLMIFMGLRSGLLIGAVLLLTVLATFIGMDLWGVNLERISLGALIIALGMLVDNAIVVTEGILIKINAGVDRLKSAKDVVSQNSIPLLGATVIAILAFSAIGLSQDSTGEYTRSLFIVIMLSLFFSWLIAITITPLFCVMFLKEKKPPKSGKPEDPYGGWFFRAYRTFLKTCIHVRWLTLGVMGGMLAVAIMGFGLLENSFFPDSPRNQFMVHVWLPEGTDIRRTSEDVRGLEQYIKEQPEVKSVTSFVGQGAPRFLLTYSPEKQYDAYAFLLVNTNDFKTIDTVIKRVDEYASKRFVDAQIKLMKFMLGPGKEDSIEIRFLGNDPNVLRHLSEQSKAIMEADGGIRHIKDNWRQRVKVIRPQYTEQQARQAGIARSDLNDMLQMVYTGKRVGIYRDGDKLLPILSKSPDVESEDVLDINNIHVWSPVAQQTIPIRQIVSGFDVAWEDGVIHRQDRKRTVTAQAVQKFGNASVPFERIKPKVEAIELPTGYTLEWGGEYEDSQDAQQALLGNMPVTWILMFFIMVMLFNSLRQPLIIALTLPLAIIGVTVGLLVTGQSFGFMALLGFLSLTGMLIKNAIVLIDQINIEVATGKEPFVAILDSCVSRLRPVSMAAVTTVLGMIPLLFDIFFIGMAVTIMAGLTFATVLTLIVVPVLYAVFFKVPYRSA